MLYRFQSAAAGDVIMTAPVAEAVLAAAGRRTEAKGIIVVADLPVAIAALEAAMQQSRQSQRAIAQQPQHESDADAEQQEPAIALHVRAQPFLELLQHSLRAQKDVVWGV